MNYAPDFVNRLWGLGVFVLSGSILYGTIQMDNELQMCNRRKLWCVWFWACIVVGLGFWGDMVEVALLPKVCLLVLEIYFVVCSTMDSMLSMVNDFMQYFGVCGGILWVLYNLPQEEIGACLLIYGVVQYNLFRRMYGSADVTAFLICALYLAGQNKNIEAYLFHMAICYLFLAVVQGARRNINERGNLKKPVPLYPYISTSFLLIFYQ